MSEQLLKDRWIDSPKPRIRSFFVPVRVHSWCFRVYSCPFVVYNDRIRS
jgi:hypothetical protein